MKYAEDVGASFLTVVEGTTNMKWGRPIRCGIGLELDVSSEVLDLYLCV